MKEQRIRKSELTSLKNKLQDAQFTLEKHEENETRFSARKLEMDEKLKSAAEQLANAKEALNRARAERTKYK